MAAMKVVTPHLKNKNKKLRLGREIVIHETVVNLLYYKLIQETLFWLDYK